MAQILDGKLVAQKTRERLRREVAELADTYILIPMEGEVESLNAAIAATVLMFEAGRQRRRK